MAQMIPAVVEEVLNDGAKIVFRARVESGDSMRIVSPRSVLGRAPTAGETWLVAGKWVWHPKYRRQFEVVRAELGRPSGCLLIQAIALNTVAFRGIGWAGARTLWAEYGDEIYGMLEVGDPSPFEDLLGSHLAQVLVDGWRSTGADARTFGWLDRHAIPVRLARKLIDIYGTLPVPSYAKREASRKGTVIWHLEDDPYRMLAFAGWPEVDKAAGQLGIPSDDDRRQVGAVEWALAKRLKEGHTWASKIDILSGVTKLLGASRSRSVEALQKALSSGAVIAHGGGVQSRGCYAMERFVHERCRAMVEGRFVAEQRRLEYGFSRAEAELVLDRFENDEGLRLTIEQREAVWMAVSRSFSTLVGGPGVGKTTVLKAVHITSETYGRTVHQAALSGRAAQRMAEATGRPAMTIASFLNRVDKGEIRLTDEPLVIVDESSMIDLATLYRLLHRLEPGARLLLVGDPGQLSPIGFGLTFHIFAEDGRIPRTTLSVVRRQTEASGIPAVCRGIREGRVPDLAFSARPNSSGVSFVEVPAHEVTDSVIDLLAQFGGVGTAQVVGSVKRGPGGVHEINGRLHAIMAVGRRECGARFHEGEPVVATRNDYEVGVMNGELGTVADGDGLGGLVCHFEGSEKRIPYDYLRDLHLAYAITCHKAQGSQFPQVIVPVTRNRLLDRSLLLTAVSRAQERVVLVGDRTVFEAAVTAPPTLSRRYVGLGRVDDPPPAQQ
jgi:exodeoxyribonuclease V alpha subunit